MDLVIPDPALVLLVGPAASGKSTFAERSFIPTEVVSSDGCRALVTDDPTNQAATGPAFEILHLIVRKRLQWRRLTAVDATNLEAAARRPLLDRARMHGVPAVAVVFDLPAEVLLARDEGRGGREVGERVIRLHRDRLERTRKELPAEGFGTVHVLRSEDEIARARIVRRPFERSRSPEPGPGAVSETA